jgi:hypothetical protein
MFHVGLDIHITRISICVLDEKGQIAHRDVVGHLGIVTVQPGGATKDARRLVFSKEGGYAAQDKDAKELWPGTFEIDPTVTPKVWDHRSHDAKK